MKITRRQLRRLIMEEASRHLSESRVDPSDIDSQDMADAKRYASEQTPEAMAQYLGISVEDWRRIRGELDDWYEDRHLLDQESWDDEIQGGVGDDPTTLDSDDLMRIASMLDDNEDDALVLRGPRVDPLGDSLEARRLRAIARRKAGDR